MRTLLSFYLQSQIPEPLFLLYSKNFKYQPSIKKIPNSEYQIQNLLKFILIIVNPN